MRRRAAAPGRGVAPPRHLIEPYVEDFVEPGDDLAGVDPCGSARHFAGDPGTRAGRVAAVAAQRLSDARHAWEREHPGSTMLLTIDEGRVWCIGAWRTDDEHRSGVGTSAPQWRDRAAWLAADEAATPW